MTMTLRTDITASQTTIDVVGTDALPPGIWHVDSEDMELRGDGGLRSHEGVPAFRRSTGVGRGALGSTAASHSAGAAVSAGAGSSGGGSISATDKQVVFMSGTDATGSPDLTWDGSVLGLTAAENGGTTIAPLGIGAQLFVRAADGDAEHVGGELSLISGDSAGQSGGQLNIVAGTDSDGGDGGPISIASGAAPDGASGDIDIRAGGQFQSASGGSISIVAGTGQAGSGGNVVINAGPKITSGSYGYVFVGGGDGNNSLELNTAGVFLTGATINFAGLPTSDPGVAGQLYSDGAPSAGVPKALMVSGGAA